MGNPTSETEEGATPFIRWSGSKKKMLPVLRRFWDPAVHTRYVELFAGSACLYFDLSPAQAVLVDKNAELVHAYLQVQHDPDATYDAYSRWSPSADEFLKVRQIDPSAMDPAERAGRFIYLMRYCYGGIYRTNRASRFNVPYGGGRTGTLPTRKQLHAVSAQLQGTRIARGDFATAVRSYAPGDFVYLDPPYALPKERKGLQYGYDSFELNAFPRLVKLLKKIDDSGASFLLSYADTPDVRESLKRWTIVGANVRRTLARDPDRRLLGAEIMCTNIAGSVQ